MAADASRPGFRLLRGDRRLAWQLMLPALALIVLIAIFPLGWTVWEALHIHDLRMPWRGSPFVGLANFGEILAQPRFWEALAHTMVFTLGSVVPEMVLGVGLALMLNRAFRGRGAFRALVLVPWAIPTVVTALLWRFLFDGTAGIANVLLVRVGLLEEPVVWFAHVAAAWVPIILADVWKTTPFVALLVLAGLQNIDGTLFEAARIDGATAWNRFTWITLPLLRPAILVALIFRTLDAFRVFDLVYVMTGGGPGTSTEPIALYTFNALFQSLRFGYGSALSLLVFATTLLLALSYLRVLGAGLTRALE
jgi:ABC-type sugar transport system permease subunit